MTRSNRLILSLLALAALPSSAAAPDEGRADAGPEMERRLFDIPSAEAWPIVRSALKDLGVTPDRTDAQHQVVVTKWRRFGAKGLEWLPAPTLPAPYAARRVRFVVFVSPFVEPARVLVGSVLETDSRAPATLYNDGESNRALMAALASRLGREAIAVPADASERQKLITTLLGDRAGGCSVVPRAMRKGVPFTEPSKIPLSEFPVIYPPMARNAGAGGSVPLSFTLLEDGGVTGIRVRGEDPGHQLEAAARGAASLLLYVPPRLGDCPVPGSMNYLVSYRMR